MEPLPELNRRRLLQAAGLVAASASIEAFVGLPPASAAPASRQRRAVAPGKALVWGHVFADANHNDTLDPGERGIADVAVSDGLTIAVTGADGRYELEVDPARRSTGLVFVSVPSGWAAPPDAGMIPTFYRQVTLAVGGEHRVDFALRRDPAADDRDYRFLAVSDPHVRPDQGFGFPFDPDPLGRWKGQVGQFNDLMADAVASHGRDSAPRFLCLTGDETEWGLATEFESFRTGTAGSAVPVWPVVGNHEYPLAWWTDPDWTYDWLVDGYRKALGPEWYSFGYGRQHFVALDNMVGSGQDEQLTWLKADLALHGRGREVVVMFHAPLPELDWWIERYYPEHAPVAQAYLDVLKPYDVRLVLSGHAHVNRVDTRILHGIPHVNTTSSYYSLDQTPLGFRVVDLRPRPVEAPYRMYGVRNALTLVHPGPGTSVPRGTLTAQASAYNTTCLVSAARYRVDGGQWQPMKVTGARTWTAPLPALPLGAHAWQVEASDERGRTWSREAEFTVVPANVVETPRSDTPWAQFHAGAGRGGHTPDVVRPPLRLAWSHPTGGTILSGSPTVAGDTAYIGVRNEDGVDGCGVVAVDLATGARKWRSKADSLVEGAPAIAGGLVLTTSLSGTLQALDAHDGEVRWQHQVDDGDPMAYASAYCSLAVADGVVLHAYNVNGGGRSAIVARDVATGDERWTFRNDFFFTATDHRPVAVGDGRVYVNPGFGFPWAIDLATGKLTWTGKLTLPPGDNAVSAGQGPCVYADGLVLTILRDAKSKSSNAVEAFDAATGEERWRHIGPTKCLVASNVDGTAPAVAGDTAFASLPSGAVVALELTSGALRWQADLGTALLSSPAVSGDCLYVGGNDGRLYALDTRSGEVLWSYDLGSWVASSPAASGNTVLVGAWDGNLYAFTAEGGSPR
ncbi:PQQ-binding-like beta-propeller repeat protein [Actinopolymorpha sp. B9G3]|uniref:outer membrane protein assembly factor BamB family protein n=1 Tax=Actinopolymorpha sp. B9G3 TaxID=3158970 RepID=UPI0032D91838